MRLHLDSDYLIRVEDGSEIVDELFEDYLVRRFAF